MNNTRKRIEKIQSGLAAFPCPTCGQMPPSEAEQQSAANLRDKAQSMLTKLLANGISREEALAMLQKYAPTLCEFLPVNFCSMCGFLPRVEAPIQSVVELRKEAEAALALLLPDYNFDKVAALAAMREIAPTLSSYLN